jgi:hypothetical protein
MALSQTKGATNEAVAREICGKVPRNGETSSHGIEAGAVCAARLNEESIGREFELKS